MCITLHVLILRKNGSSHAPRSLITDDLRVSSVTSQVLKGCSATQEGERKSEQITVVLYDNTLWVCQFGKAS